MPKSRLPLVLVILACLAGIGICLVAVLVPQPGISKQNFDWIKIGTTTLAQVEQLFGKRADENSIDNPNMPEAGPDQVDAVYIWRGNKCRAVLTIDKKGVVTGTSWMIDP